MDFKLKGKTALVAASSKGIGKACALGLAEEGCDVVCCARNRETLQAAVSEIDQKVKRQITGLALDLTHAAEIDRLVSETIEAFGRIDILVNNAGGPPIGSFMTMTDEQWQSAYNLTLMSTVRLSRAVIPYMQQNKWGRIINIASVSVKQPLDGLLLSNAYRAGVVGMAKTLATEIGPDNITINTVAPGFTLTGRLEQLFRERAKQTGQTETDLIDQTARAVPLGRLGRPEEIASLVVFLASEKASYITGTVIPVDGGFIKGL